MFYTKRATEFQSPVVFHGSTKSIFSFSFTTRHVECEVGIPSFLDGNARVYSG